MSNANTPPSFTGPGSPQDVPPQPGELGVDPATLPAPIRDELLAPDRSPSTRRPTELKDGLNRCPKCGATDIRQQARHRPAGLPVLPPRVAWRARRGAVRLRRGHRPARRARSIASGARDIAADAAVLMHVQVHRLRRRGDGQHRERDDGALPLVPPRLRRQRAGAERRRARRRAAVPHQEGRRGRAHPPVRRQAADVRAEGSSRSEFTPENVVGVYLPYMIVDGNASADVAGKGEIETRRYTRGAGNNKKTLLRRRRVPGRPPRRLHRGRPDDRIVAPNAATSTRSVNTNNIINTILPFDTEERREVERVATCAGCTSEKRDLDVAHLQPRARGPAAVDRPRAGRASRWSATTAACAGSRKRLDVHGTRWVAMYLPVWLYSYHQPGGAAACCTTSP